jgi:hypothetical protein
MSTRIRQLTLWAAAVVALAGVFVLYTRPTILVAVSDLVWACFN